MPNLNFAGALLVLVNLTGKTRGNVCVNLKERIL